jgi:hypothetical protein
MNDIVQDRLTDPREHQEADKRNPTQEGKDQPVNHDQEPPQTLPNAAPDDTPPATGCKCKTKSVQQRV